MQYKITQENLINPEWKSEVEYGVDRKEKSEEEINLSLLEKNKEKSS